MQGMAGRSTMKIIPLFLLPTIALYTFTVKMD